MESSTLLKGFKVAAGSGKLQIYAHPSTCSLISVALWMELMIANAIGIISAVHAVSETKNDLKNGLHCDVRRLRH